MAIASLRWLKAAEGGRTSPPPGPVYASTAVFVGGVNGEPSEHFSVILDFDEPSGDVKLDFLAREAVLNWLKPDARFEVMEGRRKVAEGRVLKVC